MKRVEGLAGLLMKAKFILALGVGLFVAATSALAFQEEKPGSGGQSAPAAGVDTQEAPAGKSAPSGTEVTIPGLGKLGTLPKMDFGLELLYGANDSKPVETQPANPAAAPEAEDLTIRGTMKHNF